MRACVGGAAIGRFHDARTAAGGDDIVVHAVVGKKCSAAFRGDVREFTRLRVPAPSLRVAPFADVALPKTTIVERMPCARRASSALAYSS